MIDEVKELKWHLLKNAVDTYNAGLEELAESFYKDAEECEQLLTLFREMKLSTSDWARIKELADNRRNIKKGVLL